ncbi:MAG: Fe-S protein assembly chaperone HscA [Bacteroidota bacterium]|nr:Fe-S protein assembly chaperone HscA [Bacteroidota bacterium]MDP4234670.1 Fe-S protein assembly chaperone HscA [Bacteroidota bacterium]MDP4243835.1 Fe-S protein assembly chaperone HscA [Bacteroidota bacterium]MDP4288574.1 Fe-S protein assembly chaperone HscA [Bacteroidota bacterium]
MPLEIQLPGQSNAGAGHVVGIDLGTTNSLVAYVDSGRARIISGEDGPLVPSVVTLDDYGAVTAVGKKAREMAMRDASHTVYSVKRLMGKSFQDVKKESGMLSYRLVPADEGLVRIQIGSKLYTPIELSSYVLLELKKRAETHLGEPVTRAVITVPAYFNDAQRHATKDAGRLAGLDVLRIVNEPTAAALAYGLDRKNDGTVAVYDLGGGTFDISILKIKNGIFEVLSTNGDTYLGGDDIDRRLMELFITQIQHMVAGFTPTPEQLQKIRNVAEQTKIALSSAGHVMVELDLPEAGVAYRRNLTLPEFERIAKSVIERTRKPCEDAMSDAKLNPEEIDEVVLVGGATRMPMVKALVREIFERTPHDELNPEETVALGAAIQANVLAGHTKDVLLLDVTPLSLGIETMGGMMSTIIPRNTTIPTKVTENYTTFADNQTGVEINVFQGERDFVRDNRHLAGFTLKGIPPMTAGAAKVEVTFLIDADGILQVHARETHTGIEQEVEVKPSYGLTDEEIERMLRESIEQAPADIAARRLVEAKTEAQRLLAATEKVLGQLRRGQLSISAAKLKQIDVASVIDALYSLRRAVNSNVPAEIIKQQDILEHATEPLAHEIMNATVSEALTGRTLEQV